MHVHTRVCTHTHTLIYMNTEHWQKACSVAEVAAELREFSGEMPVYILEYLKPLAVALVVGKVRSIRHGT